MKISKGLKQAVQKIKVFSAMPTNALPVQTPRPVQMASTGSWALHTSAATMTYPVPALPIVTPAVASEDLKNEAFKTPIDTLANTWLARYGPDFVPAHVVIDDDFYRIAGIRLSAAGRLEAYTTTAGQILRIIQ